MQQPSGEVSRRQRLVRAGTAVILFAATAAMTLWQNTHQAVLWDLSYLLDSSDRMALGQVPYRDFPFVHAPITFLTQALLVRLFGRVYWHHIAYAAIAGGVATLLTWRLLARLLAGRVRSAEPLAAVLCLALVPLGIYSVYPHPIYDSDCVLWLLVALWLWMRADCAWTRWLAGVALVVPVLVKQNIGLPVLLVAGVLQVALAVRRGRAGHSIREPLQVLGGIATASVASLGILQATVGLRNYYHWTIWFAAQRRLPGMGAMLAAYRQPLLLWSLPAALACLLLLRGGQAAWRRAAVLYRAAALALLAAPWVYVAAQFVWLGDADDRADALLSLWPHLLVLSAALAGWGLVCRPWSRRSLLVWLLLAAVHGTFLSQQLWGSTYAIWPLLVLLLALLLVQVPELSWPLGVVASLTLVVCGGSYALSEERLSYNHLEGAVQHAQLPALRGMAAPGPWVPRLEALVRDTAHSIPPDATIVLLPGQDPFYYASGRVPHFPVLLLDRATNPYSPAELAAAMQQGGVDWLIVNTQLQLMEPPVADYDAYLHAAEAGLVLDHEVAGYQIWRRPAEGHQPGHFFPRYSPVN
ncbi:MAG: hypothetical protein KGK08_08055 [Acidobacteriota bacterium]|nr:hypothetical protein [Acidobacteriota bacterium]